MRTTIDIDDPVLKDLKRLQAREGKSLGRLVSDLLVESIAARKAAAAPRRPFQWISRPMGARVDLSDRDALLDAIDERRP